MTIKILWSAKQIKPPSKFYDTVNRMLNEFWFISTIRIVDDTEGFSLLTIESQYHLESVFLNINFNWLRFLKPCYFHIVYPPILFLKGPSSSKKDELIPWKVH